MSDNAKCYVDQPRFRDTLTELGARHILIPPYTPRWNGKIERFFGTARPGVGARPRLANSTNRDRALSSFIRFYNRTAPARRRRRPTTHQPRPARPQAGHLAQEEAPVLLDEVVVGPEPAALAQIEG